MSTANARDYSITAIRIQGPFNYYNSLGRPKEGNLGVGSSGLVLFSRLILTERMTLCGQTVAITTAGGLGIYLGTAASE